MSTKYMDWADWAGDHHEEVEAELRKVRKEIAPLLACINDDEHAEVSATGHCENCGAEVAGFEPDDAQLLTQYGTRDVAA
jgi:hypothetical protein